MADITLSTGVEITFDLNKITRHEYLSLYDAGQPEDEENEILAKVSGLKAEDVRNMSLLDYRRFFRAFRNKVNSPLDDPND